MNRRRYLDTGLRACPQNRYGAGEQHGKQIDQNEHDQKLQTDRTPIPESMQQAPPRDGGDERSSRGGKLRADDCSPPHLIDGAPRSTGAYHQRPPRSGLIGPPPTQEASFQPIRRCSIAVRPPGGNGGPLIGPLPSAVHAWMTPPKGTCGSLSLGLIIFQSRRPKSREDTMAWTTPVLIEICIGLEINGYLPADGYVPPEF